MPYTDLKELLNKKYKTYNTPKFIHSDPVSIPHNYSLKQDIEIAGLFASIFAWGQRITIIKKSTALLERMDNAPYDFVVNHTENDLHKLAGFVHRTFNDTDLLYFIHFLKTHYAHNDSLETAFANGMKKNDTTIEHALIHFNTYFFASEHAPVRTRKHISSPLKGSSCKRLCMYLRWMVRQDTCGVDFGIWTSIKPSQLICPIDIHVERVARKLGLITQKQVNWKTAIELTEALKQFDPADPVKYDFALFGMGVLEKY